MPQDYSAYNTIFDVLVNPGAIKKRQKRKGEPNKFNIPPLSALGEGLGEMLANPGLYPVEEVMGTINEELDTAGFEVQLVRRGNITNVPGSGKHGDWILGQKNVQDGKDVKFGFGLGSFSAFLANPRGFADSIAKKYEGARKEARWGRFAKGIDQASVFLWSASKGVDVGTSVRAARAIGSGSSSFMGTQKAERSALESAVEGLRTKYGIDRKTLDRIIGKSFNIGGADDKKAKRDRLNFIRDEIKKAGVLSGPGVDQAAEDIAQRIYGERGEDKDFGILTEDADQHQALRNSLMFELEQKMEKARSANDTKAVQNIQNLMTLVNRRAAGQFNRGLAGNLGLVVGKFGSVYNWAKWQSGGKFISTLVSGEMFYNPKYGWGILKKSPKEGIPLVDRNGNVLKDSAGNIRKQTNLFIETSLPQSKMLYLLRYAHPVNLIRSTIWDGNLWMEIARRSAGGGAINADSIFYKLWGMMPKRGFEKIQAFLMDRVVGKAQKQIRIALAKGVKKVFGKYIRKTVSQLASLGVREIIKEALLGVVTAVFGIGTGGAGLVVGVILFALDIVGGWLVRKLIRPLIELLSIFIIGALLFTVVGVSSVVGLFTSDDMSELAMPHLDPAVQVSDAEPVGTSSPIPGGQGMYSGTYSGTGHQIMEAVGAEMGVSVDLQYVDCAGADCGGIWCEKICGAQGSSCLCESGAWCYNSGPVLYCRGVMIEGSSESYLTRLFRHEAAHNIQFRNASTWPSWGTYERQNVTEWGAEHISGNGGSYCFSTVGGYMSGTSVTQALLSQGCSSTLIDRASVADYNALIELESTCGVSPRTYIISRTIGGSCN